MSQPWQDAWPSLFFTVLNDAVLFLAEAERNGLL